MNVIITGATSFLGLAVSRHLLAAGHSVGAVVRPDSASRNKLPNHERLTVYDLNVGEIELFFQKISGAEVFLHMAWDGIGSAGRQDPEIQKLNVDYSLRAVRAAKALGCRRFVFSGSQAEYGIHRDTISEESACAPVSEYGKAKLEFADQAKTLCKTLNMEYIHTRIFSVYGPGDHPWSLVSSCLSRWQQGQTIALGECSQLWNYLYIRDAAAGLAALMESGESGIYNLAGEDTRPLREFIEAMYEACGGKGSYHYGQRQPNAEGPASLMPSIEKIRKQTGWKPRVSFSEGIDETLHCMRGEIN